MSCSCWSWITALITVLVSVFAYLKVKALFAVPPIPKLEEVWWGPRKPEDEDAEIKPFKIDISNEILEDLKYRLEHALPFQAPLEGVKQNYGMNTNLLNTIVDFWKAKYDWREREKFLNQYPQFTVSVQGLRIHYIRVKPTETKDLKVLPLLLLHGWPGSVREFYEIIPLLTTPQPGRRFVFEVIVPSLPGYGFSEAAVKPGLGVPQIALIFKNLMSKIGFEKYYLQGGDWGAGIVSAMSALFPENILGVHSNMCAVVGGLANLKTFLGSFYPSLLVTEVEKDKVYPLGKRFGYLMLESGYMHLQATKPDTVGVALRESPVGLAAYILEKFTSWTNPAYKDLDDGGLTLKYTYTNLLDNVMIYWVTRSITTSMRLYGENFGKAQKKLNLDAIPVTVPSAAARFSYELFYSPESIIRDKYKNLLHIADYEGGHFVAFEVPKVLAEDIYTFIEKAETYHRYTK